MTFKIPLTVRIDLSLSDEEFDKYCRQAVMRGFVRENPTKRWTIAEKKEVVRFVVSLWDLELKNPKPVEEISEPFVQEMGHRSTAFGNVLYIKVKTNDNRKLSWTEVSNTFKDRYPEQWAMQFFPPQDQVVDEANIYHLFVLDEEPHGFNINRR